jgi:hypothetical protein
MKRVSQKLTALIKVGLTIAVFALVIFWSGWREELQAQSYNDGCDPSVASCLDEEDAQCNNSKLGGLLVGCAVGAGGNPWVYGACAIVAYCESCEGGWLESELCNWYDGKESETSEIADAFNEAAKVCAEAGTLCYGP